MNEPSSPPADGRPSLLARGLALAELALWASVFGILWFFVPPSVKILSLAWAALGAAGPWAFLVSLGLAFPFFGNNPGGEHHLYLLDMALMGFVARDLALRILGRRIARPGPLNAPIRLFVLVSALALLPQRLHLECEFRQYGAEGLFNIYRYYANAPFYGLRAWLNLALAASMFAALRDAPPPDRWRRRFWLALVGGLALASIVGLLEYPEWISVEWWRGENPMITRFGYRRLQSLFWHSGWFASRRRSARGTWLALAALLGAAQLMTMQRGGWLALATGFGAVGAVSFMLSSLRRRHFIKLLLAAGVAFAMLVSFAAAAHPTLRHRLGEMLNYNDRRLIWGSAINLWRLDPWTGIGIGNYTPSHLRFIPPESELYYADDKTTGHNTCLHLGAERGLLAVAIFLWIYWGAVARLARRIWLPGSSGQIDENARSLVPLRAEPLALLGGIAALGVDGIFQYIFYIRLMEILFWIFIAFAAGSAGTVGDDRRSASPSRAAAFAWPAVALLLAALFFWKDRYTLGPWTFGTERGQFAGGPGEVALALPRGARRVAVPVYAFAQELPGKPLTFAFYLEGSLLATKTFEKQDGAEVELELPANRNPRAKLVIRASRVWNPYVVSERALPLTEMGVMYRGPRALD